MVGDIVNTSGLPTARPGLADRLRETNIWGFTSTETLRFIREKEVGAGEGGGKHHSKTYPLTVMAKMARRLFIEGGELCESF